MDEERYKLDLHIHSILSHDGIMIEKDFKNILDRGILDYIAITDHNEIEFAKHMNESFGDKVIIGEEVSTKQGHLIGLFLKYKIESGRDIRYTVQEIKDQQGLVYVPHPFDYRRSGVDEQVLNRILENIDIIETFNSRSIFGSNRLARSYALENELAKASGSDSHTKSGVGKTFNYINEIPNVSNLVELLKDHNSKNSYVNIIDVLGPKLNKLRKRYGKI